jgi:drug/metabolite transporter (DMT)-like permease
MSAHSLGLFYAAFTGLCWAVLAIGLKYALHFSSSGTIAWVRMIVAFFILFFYYALKNPRALKRALLHPPKKLLLAGVFLACNYYGYMRGIDLTNASNAQIMIQTGPLTLILVGVFYFKEHLKSYQWLGVLSAICGFIFFNWDQVLIAFEHSDKYIAGNIWLLFAGVTWATFAAIQKFVLINDVDKNWPPQLINLLIYAVCSVVLVPMANFQEFSPLTTWQWFVLFLLGANTLLAYGAFGEAMRLIPASHVSLIITLNPLFTILFVTLLTHYGFDFIAPEPIEWRGILGAFLVVFGVGLAVYRRRRVKTSSIR